MCRRIPGSSSRCDLCYQTLHACGRELEFESDPAARTRYFRGITGRAGAFLAQAFLEGRGFRDIGYDI